MAVKAKNKKKLQMAELIKNSTKIKCCYCDLSGKCSLQASKEKSENMGIITHCTLTPNTKKKKKTVKKRTTKNNTKRG
jgi:hypothetical protein